MYVWRCIMVYILDLLYFTFKFPVIFWNWNLKRVDL